MARRIKYIEFPNGNNELSVEFELSTYVLIMYYAAQLDYQKALKLFHSTIPEWKYRFEYELTEGGYDSDNPIAHFVSSEATDSIAFINNQVIPSLIAEPEEEIINKYGGKVNFESIYDDDNFLQFVSIYNEEYYGNKFEIWGLLEKIRNILQESVNTNIPLHTWTY